MGPDWLVVTTRLLASLRPRLFLPLRQVFGWCWCWCSTCSRPLVLHGLRYVFTEVVRFVFFLVLPEGLMPGIIGFACEREPPSLRLAVRAGLTRVHRS